jgi:hypothetical protein
MKKYKYPKTKQLIKQLKPFLLYYELVEEEYWKYVHKIEKSIQTLTGIPDIELFFCDNEFSGIGNSERTMELIHRHELEESNG